MNIEKETISIIGCGYVGLVTGTCLSSLGKKVVCIDKNKKIINSLNAGILTIHEKNLFPIFKKNLNKKLFFSNNIKDSILKSNISIIAVGTPVKNNKINYEYISSSIIELAKILKNKNKYHLIVIKSTILPTTCEKIIIPLFKKHSQKKINKDFDVVVNPEFLREGEAVNDFLKPDRIVIGSENSKARFLTKNIYSKFNNRYFHFTNLKTAELIKCASNSLFGTLISFSNEVSNLANTIGGIDTKGLFGGIIKDRRITTKINSNFFRTAGIASYISPGPGFGGSCLPKDILSLVRFGKNNKNQMKILDAVFKTNKNQYLKIIKYLKNELLNSKIKTVTILGLSFKPETDDLRESPSIKLINKIIKFNCLFKLHDPICINSARKIIGFSKNVIFSKSIKSAITNSDIIIVMTYWKDYMNLHEIMNNSRSKALVIDTRNALNSKKFNNYISL